MGCHGQPTCSVFGTVKKGVRHEKFQFLEKGQNHNFDYKIVISIKNLKSIL